MLIRCVENIGEGLLHACISSNYSKDCIGVWQSIPYFHTGSRKRLGGGGGGKILSSWTLRELNQF